MKVSVIIAVYKDVEALNLIFESLARQTYREFEVIVAEDGMDEQMAQCVADAREKYDFEIKHTTQEDKGVRKSHSQNNAIRASSGEYLIFIDGDCILYRKFIENHVLLSARKAIVTGRRVNLGQRYSQALREGRITAESLEKKFIFKYLDIARDAKEEKHTEEGFEISYNGFIHRLLKKRKKEMALLGCNMSMYKDAILEINGFDEDLGNSAYASDSDLQWRFKALGYRIISARFLANEFHLYHKRGTNEFNREMEAVIAMNQKAEKIICSNGVKKL